MARKKDKNPIDEREDMTVTLTLDDDRELECAILTILEAGGRDYIALLPLDDAEAEEGEVYLYRYSEVDGQPELDNIKDDEEYEIVADAFDEFLDSQEYDEIITEEQLEELKLKRAIQEAMIERTKEAAEEAKEQARQNEAPEIEIGEMVDIAKGNSIAKDVGQSLSDIKSSLRVLEADLKGIKVDKEV